MPPKSDPYATKLHKRIDLLLLAVTLILVLLVLHSSAHGRPISTLTPPPVSAALYPFQAQPDVCLGFVAD